MNRLAAVGKHFTNDKTLVSPEQVTLDGVAYPEVIDHHPNREIKIHFWQLHGWGYKDSGFAFNKDQKMVKILGNRYMFGGQYLPKMGEYIESAMGANMALADPPQQEVEANAPIVNQAFLEELGTAMFSRRSFNKYERVLHSHGQCLHEMWSIRYEKFDRLADVVIYPNSTEEVEYLIKMAVKHDVVLVPYGGGTNVTKALQLSAEERRMIVSVDMTRMNQIKWVNKEDNLACIGAGVFGQDLERDLKKYGVTTGHEPDSHEFSTLGGWISTRASGMKKNTYGNIEDIVMNFTIVTPTGTYTKSQNWPRTSNGIDINQVVLGSEGNLGIITEATVRIRPLPQTKVYDSLIFPNFEVGIKFMQQVAKTRNWPTSIRLIDNTQFQFGASLKPQSNSMWNDFVEAAKKFFVVKIKGFDPNEMAAVTMLFEGDEEWARTAQKQVLDIGKKYGGLVGGQENGMRGYLLTFLIAYTRDLAMNHHTLAESFETSCPWSMVSELCRRVKKRLYDEAGKQGFSREKVWISFRVTQLYETGAAIYVYLTLYHRGMDRSKVIEMYEVVEDAGRDEVMLCGGSLSHHHGIGKIRKKFMDRTQAPISFEWQNAIKKAVDPQNIFAINNSIARSDEEKNAIKEGWKNRFDPVIKQ